MAIVLILVCIILGYFFGSFPSGLVVVRLMSGKDVREVGSGRTGGTNAFRAAGPAAGILTGVLDGLKGAIAVWVATFITGGNHYAEVFAGLAAVLGHIYSIFLAQRDEQGHWHFKGGAGGGPSVGAAAGLWIWSLAFIVPVGLFVFFGIGYASLTTLSFGITALIIFTVRYLLGYGPWEHILYGVLVLILQILALRPNFPRLLDGTERAHSGWAKRRAARIAAQTGAQAGQPPAEQKS